MQAVDQAGGRAHHAEGIRAGRWALLDFVNVVVHVFHPTLREYYQLERLWADAPALDPAALETAAEPAPSGRSRPRKRRTG